MLPITYSNFSSRKFIVPALIFISCFVLYGNTLQNGYALDDEFVTYKNTFIIKGFSEVKEIFTKGSFYGFDNTRNSGIYRPLTLLNFMASVSIFGFNPHIGHFFNVLFFALTVVLLYFFLQKILKNYKPGIVIAATLLFAFHPIHTEVVANIKSRDEILVFLFGLSSFYLIMLYHEKNKIYYYFFSLAAFFAALFCKEDSITYVAIIPLLLYFFTSLELKKIALQSLPYIGLVVIYLLIRSHILQNMALVHEVSVKDNALMAATNSAERTATSFVLLGKYIYMTFIPYPLSYDYSYNQIPIVSWTNIKPALSVLVCTALIVFMLWGFKKKSIFSFLIALFFITLALAPNLIIRIAATFGERFLYAPSLSLCIALPILTAKALERMKNKHSSLLIPIGCLLIIYAIITIPRNAVWKNDFTLFSSGVITSPNSGKTHGALAEVYLDSAQFSKDTVKRLSYYSLGLEEFKKTSQFFTTDPECYYNMGICYYAEGYQDSAVYEYKKALELNPKYSPASNNLGTFYFNKMQFDSALPYFFMSYKADSNNFAALINIATSYQNEKNLTMAFYYDSLALKKDPGNKTVLINLSKLHNYMGAQYYTNNELDKALEELAIAINCDSNNADAIGNIGGVYAKMGNNEMAKKYFEKALSINPKKKKVEKYLQFLNEKH